MYKDPKTNLVPCRIIKSSASAGVRKDEIRGFSEELAEKLEKSGHVKPLTAKEVAALQKKKAKVAAETKAKEPKPEQPPEGGTTETETISETENA